MHEGRHIALRLYYFADLAGALVAALLEPLPLLPGVMGGGGTPLG